MIFTVPATPMMVETKRASNPFESILNMLFTPAQAMNMTSLLFGAGGAAAGMMLGDKFGGMIDGFLHTPLRRGIVWGVLAGLAYMAMSSTQGEIDKIDEQIKKIDEIIAAMETNGSGNASGNSNPTSSALFSKTNNTPLSKDLFTTSNKDGINNPCVIGGGSGNCPSVKSAIANSDPTQSNDPSLQAVGLGVGTLADKIQGKPGITNGALESANGVLGSANLVKKAIAKTKASINDQLRKMGQTPIDFKKEEAQLTKQLLNTTENAMRKSGGSFGGGMGSGGDTSSAGDKANGKEDGSLIYAKNKPSPLSSGSAPRSRGLDFKEDRSGLQTGAEVTNPGTMNDNYKLNKAEISTDPAASIFNVISERYFKSGYPKLLEEDAPAAAPVKKEKK
jgi:hypothetical protein